MLLENPYLIARQPISGPCLFTQPDVNQGTGLWVPRFPDLQHDIFVIDISSSSSDPAMWNQCCTADQGTKEGRRR